MKIDLPELERKLSYGINLTIKESTILLESMEGFIDDKIELQEQLNTAKKALTEISKTKVPFRNGIFYWEEFSQDALKAQKALAAIGNEGSGDE
ncbi:hypothetical protein P7D17_05365 [Lactococcus petauri]|uniref:Uncharacterized protein n=1 Tax=Lactococcus petauri TaxID=1940789 RepID=A0AAJ2IU32_9LACT|nr:hypothetical protein [Lactococcus petauri]MDT2583542.1 hypothetical protein [Lactococcus petauri]